MRDEKKRKSVKVPKKKKPKGKESQNWFFRRVFEQGDSSFEEKLQEGEENNKDSYGRCASGRV